MMIGYKNEKTRAAPFLSHCMYQRRAEARIKFCHDKVCSY